MRREPKDPRGYGQLAQLLLSVGDYQRASNFATAALSYKPDYPEALVVQGQLYGMRGRSAEAGELLKKACDLDPKNAEAHFQLGIVFDRKKRNIEGSAEFEKVVALRPDDPRAWDYLALNLEPLGHVEKADAAYRRGLAVNKGPLLDSFLDYNYGRFLMKQNRLAESKQYLDRALRLAPKTRAVHFEHGKMNLLLKNYPAARIDVERALELSDAAGVILDVQVYYLLTTIYQRLGEEALARKYAEHGSQMNARINAESANPITCNIDCRGRFSSG
jgi:Tfp pilus assembly protein PilF